jgi:hypothetical protein
MFSSRVQSGLGPKQKRKAKARIFQKGAEHVPFNAQTFPSLGPGGVPVACEKRSGWVCIKPGRGDRGSHTRPNLNRSAQHSAVCVYVVG